MFTHPSKSITWQKTSRLAVFKVPQLKKSSAIIFKSELLLLLRLLYPDWEDNKSENDLL